MNVTITRSGTPPKVVMGRIDKAVDTGVQKVTKVAHQIAAARIMQIYMRRIPTRAEQSAYEQGKVFKDKIHSRKTYRRSMKGNQAMWRRTGELRKSLWSATAWSPGEGAQGWVKLGAGIHKKSNSRQGVYGNKKLIGGERTRHGLMSGGSDHWKPEKPALGIYRKNPWFQETAQRLEPLVIREFDKGFKEAMNK